MSLFLVQSCKDFSIAEKGLFIENNSSKKIVVADNQDKSYVSLYPDTNISEAIIIWKYINRNTKSDFLWNRDWEGGFNHHSPNGIKTIFIFDADTVDAYPMEVIRTEYKVLARYDVSLSDLEKRNFVLEYPYDESKGKLKVYIP